MFADASSQLSQWWGPALAFVAGLVSFASPCVLPLVPGYLSFVVGERAVDRADERTDVVPILLFVGGFTLVFVLLGAFAHEVVRLFKGTAGQWVAGLVIGALGALMIAYGLRRGSLALYEDRRPFLARARPGVVGAFPLGMAFAAGWTPCIGPVLGAILVFAASGSTARGAFLMLCYSLGLGVPFLVIGLGAQWLTGTVAWLREHFDAISVVSGTILLIVGWLVATGQFTRLIAPLTRYAPGL